MTTLVVLVAVVIFATLASAWANAVRSAALRRKFEELGMIPGRTLDEVVRHVGKPTGRHRLDPEREVLFWRRINFRVALVFFAGVCESVDYDSGA